MPMQVNKGITELQDINKNTIIGDFNVSLILNKKKREAKGKYTTK